METTLATAIEQQYLSQEFANNLTTSNNDIELDLENIIIKELEQAFPADVLFVL